MSVKCSRTFTLIEAEPELTPFCYYKLDEASLADEAVDQVSAYNMPWAGGTILSTGGKIGTAFSFPDSHLYRVESPSSAHWDFSGASFMIRAWGYAVAGGFASCTLISNDVFTLAFDPGTDTFTFEIELDDGWSDVATLATTTGAWHRVVAWYEHGVGIGIKLDNDADVTLAKTNLHVAGNQRLYIGAGALFSSYSVDEVGIWKQILTPAELLTDWNGGAGTTYP